MTLQLLRPLVFLDLETTGVDPRRNRICQIGVVKQYPDGQVTEWETLVDPEVSILPEVAEIHGITDARIAEERPPIFRVIAPKLASGLKDVDFAGFNLRFDMSFLQEEFRRVGYAFPDTDFVDAFSIFKMKEPRSLRAAVKRYCADLIDSLCEDCNCQSWISSLGVCVECEKGFHGALVDAKATQAVLLGQLREHPELPRTVDGLISTVREEHPYDGKLKWMGGELCVNFGKRFMGVPLQRVSRDYLEWMARSEFPLDVKRVIEDALRGNFPVKPEVKP